MTGEFFTTMVLCKLLIKSGWFIIPVFSDILTFVFFLINGNERLG